MIGFFQHQLAKWLSSILQLVLTSYSTHCIQDSFTFAEKIKSSTLKPSSVFLGSFDIASLFTTVYLAETIQICTDALYNTNEPPFPKRQHALLNLASMMLFTNKPTGMLWDPPPL